MVHDRETAATLAESAKTNTPGMCQAWTRTMFNAPSVGDQDGDKDADAVDGWRSEPLSAKHSDRNPPRGVPGSFSGGSKGFGHRVVCLGNGLLRSIDMNNSGRYTPGVVGTCTIAQIELAMNVRWLGWSDTISGLPIPLPPLPPAPPVLEPTKVSRARKLLRKAKQNALAKGKTKRAAWIQRMLDAGPKR